MTPAVRGPEPGKTFACPECDSANQVVERMDDCRGPQIGDESFACYDCGARFDEPDVRAVDAGGVGGGDTAYGEEFLAAMDPDDFPPGREGRGDD